MGMSTRKGKKRRKMSIESESEREILLLKEFVSVSISPCHPPQPHLKDSTFCHQKGQKQGLKHPPALGCGKDMEQLFLSRRGWIRDLSRQQTNADVQG